MHVLVVEDEKKVAAFIKAGLEEQGYQATCAHDGNSALLLATKNPYDALILDIMIPGPDGLSVLRSLREQRLAIPVILLSARAQLNERVEGLNMGADDYLPKPFSIIELLARLRAVLRRRTGDASTLLACGDLVMNFASREVRRGGQRIDLSPREFSLLECLLRSQGRPRTRTELTQEVWGYQFDPGTNVVDVAIQRLRRKIDDPSPVKLIQTVRGLGYALRSE
jgi:DNA-binding response OmpR family regulator